jgi:hypothetical protein
VSQALPAPEDAHVATTSGGTTPSPVGVCWNAEPPLATWSHLFGGEGCRTCHLINGNRTDAVVLAALYSEVCTSFHAITEFRAKLLAFLPTSSAAAIFLLLGTNTAEEVDRYLLPIGILGFLVTIGLLIYETEGNRKCVALEGVGAALECALTPEGERIIGQFHSKFRGTFRGPHDPHMPWPLGRLPRFVGAGGAAGVIYVAVLMAWIALMFDGIL